MLLSNHVMLADQYFERLAFGWQKRCRLLDSHGIGFAELIRIDQGIAACARALVDIGPIVASVLLQRFEDPIIAPETFAMTLCAIGRHDRALFQSCIALVQSMPQHRAAFLSALEWAAPDALLHAVSHLERNSGLHIAASIVAATVHGDLRAAVVPGIWSAAEPFREECGLMLMQLALQDHGQAPVGLAIRLIESPIPEVRCAAADFLLSRPHSQHSGAALACLQALAQQAGPGQTQAVFVLASHAPQALEKQLGGIAAMDPRLHILALGWLGRSAHVPTLIDYLSQPALARLAGAMLSQITGSQPAADAWQAPPADYPASPGIDDTDAIPAPRPDAGLPEPDPAAFAAWWNAHQRQFDPGQRYLGGQNETAFHLLTILQQGRLAWRPLAAHRLQQLGHGARLNTTLPASIQLAQLHRLAQTAPVGTSSKRSTHVQAFHS